MEKELVHKSFGSRLEEKAEGEDGRLHIKFYALAFGNVDSWGDIIDSKACDAFMQSENRDRMKLCYQHNAMEVIGVINDVKVDAVGMLVEADILPTATGKDVMTLLKAGAITEFSIGYYADEYHYEKRQGYDTEIRVLDAITIVEASPVTRAANPKAILLDAKGETNGEGMKALTDRELEELESAVKEEMAKRLILHIQ